MAENKTANKTAEELKQEAEESEEKTQKLVKKLKKSEKTVKHYQWFVLRLLDRRVRNRGPWQPRIVKVHEEGAFGAPD